MKFSSTIMLSIGVSRL